MRSNFQIPELPLPSLLSLDLSMNMIDITSTDRASNLSLLRHLDLSYNLLNAFPSIITNLPELNSLNLAGNRIYDLNNNTFTMGIKKLISLDLSYLPLVSFEVRPITIYFNGKLWFIVVFLNDYNCFADRSSKPNEISTDVNNQYIRRHKRF